MSQAVWLPYSYDAEFRNRNDSGKHRVRVVETAPFQIDEAASAELAFEIDTPENGTYRWLVVDGRLMREVLGPDEKPISFADFLQPVVPKLMTGHQYYTSGWQDHPMHRMFRFFDDNEFLRDAQARQDIEAGIVPNHRGQFWKFGWSEQEGGLARASRIADGLRTFQGALLRPAHEPLIAVSCNPRTEAIRIETVVPPLLMHHNYPATFFRVDEHHLAVAAAEMLAGNKGLFPFDPPAIEDKSWAASITGNWAVTGEPGVLALEQYVEAIVISERSTPLEKIDLGEVICYGAARHALLANEQGDQTLIAGAMETIAAVGRASPSSTRCRQLAELIECARIARANAFGELPERDEDAISPRI